MDNILKDAAVKGLTFISDRDGRDAGGLHPNAHLWDVGKNAITGLQEVIKVREKALAQFGENSLVNGSPMALLEDVLRPWALIFFHRFHSYGMLLEQMPLYFELYFELLWCWWHQSGYQV